MFIDRQREIEALLKRAASPKAEFVVLYGRRRVGKTGLIDQFIKRAGGVRLLATEGSEALQLRSFSQTLAAYLKDDVLASSPLASWEAFFKYVARHAGPKRLILAIDEFPYLVQENRALPSILQAQWDTTLKDLNLMLLVSGSSVSMMEQLFSGRAPLYGRRTAQLLLRPLNYPQCWSFLSKKPDEAVAKYAVFGGTPAYLVAIDPALSLWDNIEREVFDQESFLFNEVPFLLREELREPRIYFACLSAIAHGRTKLSDILNYTGLPRETLTKYLAVLAEMDLILREVPVTDPHPDRSHMGRYRIVDPFFRFWFRYVHPHRDLVERGQAKEIMRLFVRPTFGGFVGGEFERIARGLVTDLCDAKKLPVWTQRLGRWWAKDVEIDMVGTNPQENSILFGEAKWTSERVGVNVLKGLATKAAHVSWGGPDRKEHYIVISRSGFEPAAISYARSAGIMTFSLDQALRLLEAK
jgi:AAA+ ATPase superfamily predicted ATPase